jgi:hypothetical protein
MSETPFLLLQGSVLLAGLALARYRNVWLAVLVGVLAGLTILTRGIFMLMLPLLALWLWFVLGKSRRAILVTLLMLGITGATLVPWMVRNWAVHGTFVLITTKIGYNLYYYNYPTDDTDFFGRRVPMPDMDGLSEAERQSEFTRRGIEFLANNPYFAKFMAAKFLDLWNPIPNTNRSVLVLVSILSFLVWLALAVLGLVFFLRNKAFPYFNLLLYTMTIVYVGMAMLFFGGQRARLPIEYLLLLSSAPFLAALITRRRTFQHVGLEYGSAAR